MGDLVYYLIPVWALAAFGASGGDADQSLCEECA